jgi:hypothetical protein
MGQFLVSLALIVVRKQYVQHLKRRDLYNVFLRRSVLFLKRIEERDLIGQENTLAGQMSSGMRSFGVMRHGHNLENIHGPG